MAAIDPYAPCPCGSGNKFKWCCHKIESYADKSFRLFENGQVEASLAMLDEGLVADPGNAWLLIRKAWILSDQKRASEAVPLVEDVLRRNRSHVGAQVFLTRLKLQTQGLRAAVDQFQEALNQVSAENRPALGSTAELMGIYLGKLGMIPAARAHLKTALQISPQNQREAILSELDNLEGTGSVPVLLREDLRLSPAPEGLDPTHRQRFEEALDGANGGRWAAAAAAFDLLAGDGIEGADWNLGLCRFWLLDVAGAVEAWRRAARRLGTSAEAVDIEAICQLIEPVGDGEKVEQVQLIWTLRDRKTLIERLESNGRVSDEGEEPLDPDQPENGVMVQVFALLDRPKPAEGTAPDFETWPKVLARALIGREIAILETYDDGRLDSLSGWFTDLAGETLPPAQPRTKKIGEIPRSDLAMRSDLLSIEDVSPAVAEELTSKERTRILTEVWPETSMSYLGGRTPRQAAAEGGWEIPLRAAVLRYATNRDAGQVAPHLAQLRAELRLPEEPVINPAEVDLATVSPSRLDGVNAEELPDDKLVTLYHRAQELMVPGLIEKVSRVLVERPELLDRSGIGRVKPYADLALLSLPREGGESALSWINRGREADPQARAANAAAWDMLEIRVRSYSEQFESWVPFLAGVLERYGKDHTAFGQVMMHLVDMGLVGMEPHPDNPDQLMVDTRILQSLLTQYGPRITTADGAIGVTAGQRVWTPETPAAGSTTPGGIWTPGSSPNRPDEGKSKLIIPGR